MNSPRGDEANSEDFFLIQGDELAAYLQQKNFFEWAPGLLSLEDESRAVFPKE
jgi:guanylate kinase